MPERVELVISDSYHGLQQALQAVLPGAGWQRCRIHAMRTCAPGCASWSRRWWPRWSLVRSIFAQPDATSTLAQHARVVEQRAARFPLATALLADAAGALLAFAPFH